MLKANGGSWNLFYVNYMHALLIRIDLKFSYYLFWKKHLEINLEIKAS